MSFEKKKEAALEELSQTGIWKLDYKPPALTLLWSLGFKLKPPHYRGFFSNAIPLSVWFAVFWGVSMWFIQWRATSIGINVAIVISIGAGIFFGLSMATYYRWSARKNQLSNWDALEVRDKNA